MLWLCCDGGGYVRGFIFHFFGHYYYFDVILFLGIVVAKHTLDTRQG